MTQIASFDIGALAAKRQAAPVKGAPKGQGDFMAAFRHAANETRKAERTQETDRPHDARPDRDADAAQDTADAAQARQADKADQQDRADKANQANQADQAQAPKADDAPVAKNDQPQAEQPQAQAQQADQQTNDQAQAQQAADAAQAAQQADAQAQALDAQAVLALQLATGGQVAQPTVQVTAKADADAQAVTAVQPQAQAQVQAQAQQADAQAQAQALLQAQNVDTNADQAVKDAIAKAAQATQQAQPQANAQAQTQVNANAQAQSPAFQAAADLNIQTVQVSQQPKPESPVAAPVANTAEAQPDKSANLMVDLINDLKAQVPTTGSTTPVTTLDDAAGIETQSQAVSLLADEDNADEAATAAPSDQPATPLLNGEAAKVDATKAAAPAKEAHAPVHAEDVMPQVLKHAEQLKANQANTIKLQLYPEHLGKMEIKVMAHQGVLSAQISADSQSVKSMLETQVAALQRSFAELGLKVDKVEVALSSSNLGNDQFGGQAMQQGAHQQFGRQQQHPGANALSNSGYGQWLGEEPADETVYAELDSAAAVNYVA